MATQKHTCPDCGKELNVEVQVWKHKPEPTITYTCKTTDCELHGVTLTWDVWEAKIADGSIEAYREINCRAAMELTLAL